MGEPFRGLQRWGVVGVDEEMIMAQNAEPMLQDKVYHFIESITKQQLNQAAARPLHRVTGHGPRTSLPTKTGQSQCV